MQKVGAMYKVVTKGASWSEANSVCSPGHLAIADTTKSLAVIGDMLGSGYGWIGASDMAVEGTFVWVDDRSVVGDHWMPDEA